MKLSPTILFFYLYHFFYLKIIWWPSTSRRLFNKSKSYAVPNIISIYSGFATPDGVLSVPISSNRSFQLHGFCVRCFGLQPKSFLTIFLILFYFPYSSNPRTNQVFGNFYLLSLYQTMRNRSFFYCLPYSSFLFCNRVCSRLRGQR